MLSINLRVVAVLFSCASSKTKCNILQLFKNFSRTKLGNIKLALLITVL